MSSLIGHEEAAAKMAELLRSNSVLQLKRANEAKTRLLVIDEILNLLGWPKVEYDPEHRTPTGNYTDYLLSLEEIPRLVVEAKRTNLFEALPKAIQKRLCWPKSRSADSYVECRVSAVFVGGASNTEWPSSGPGNSRRRTRQIGAKNGLFAMPVSEV